METKILKAYDVINDSAAIDIAAAAVKNGECIVLPTETVYGIGANALDKNAVKKIFAAKHRPADNPLILHVSGVQMWESLVQNLNNTARDLMEKFMPGPLTIILKRSSIVPDIVSAALDTVAVRMPSHKIALEIIKRSGVPIAAPSANISGKPSPTCAGHCIEDMCGKVKVILDSGKCGIGVESTVISLVNENPVLLRPGYITVQQLREFVPDLIVDKGVENHVEENSAVSSPGMKYKHYSPDAQVVVVHANAQELAQYLVGEKKTGDFALVFEGQEEIMPIKAVNYGRYDDSASQAKKLFAALRKLDKLNAKRIFALSPKKDGIGLAVYNRLIRSAGFREIWL